MPMRLDTTNIPLKMANMWLRWKQKVCTAKDTSLDLLLLYQALYNQQTRYSIRNQDYEIYFSKGSNAQLKQQAFLGAVYPSFGFIYFIEPLSSVYALPWPKP